MVTIIQTTSLACSMAQATTLDHLKETSLNNNMGIGIINLPQVIIMVTADGPINGIMIRENLTAKTTDMADMAVTVAATVAAIMAATLATIKAAT